MNKWMVFYRTKEMNEAGPAMNGLWRKVEVQTEEEAPQVVIHVARRNPGMVYARVFDAATCYAFKVDVEPIVVASHEPHKEET
jgi:hypothetical protein